jgi:hypothetical protein
MRILGLAKELGIPYERLLDWCRDAGLEYRNPDDEMDSEHAGRARAAFLPSRSRKEGPYRTGDEDLEAWMDDADLDTEEFPQTLEELEAIERSIHHEKPIARSKKAREDRIPLTSLLKKYGIEEKSTAKKIRKMLPEDISRLFNHEDLTDDQAGRLQDALENRVPLCCGHSSCREMLEKWFGAKKLILTREATACRLCGGSSTRRALEEMARVCGEANVHRILVVGGAPSSHNELKNSRPDTLEFRLVEGDVSRDKQRAAADLKWCDVAVIWAGTILGHEVSQNYMRGRPPGGAPVLVIKRRSVEALADAVVHHLKGKKR